MLSTVISVRLPAFVLWSVPFRISLSIVVRPNPVACMACATETVSAPGFIGWTSSFVGLQLLEGEKGSFSVVSEFGVGVRFAKLVGVVTQ